MKLLRQLATRYCLTLVVVLAACGFGHRDPANAQDELQTVTLQLRGPGNPVSPGQAFTVTVGFSIEAPWHIYWSNPGYSGMPTKLDWNLPKGFVIKEVNWPAPQKFVTPDGVFFGYSGRLDVQGVIQVPSSWSGRREVTVGVESRWLACHAQCVPGIDFSAARILVSDSPPRDSDRIEEGTPTDTARSPSFPRLPSGAGVNLRVTNSTNQPANARRVLLWVRVAGDARRHWRARQPYFFPDTAGIFQPQPLQKVVEVPGGFFIVLPLEAGGKAAPKRIRGVLAFSSRDPEPDPIPPVIVDVSW